MTVAATSEADAGEAMQTTATRRGAETIDSSDSWRVSVRVVYQGQRMALDLRSDNDVASLTTELQQRIGIQQARQRLICRGTVLSDKNVKLEALAPRGKGELVVMLVVREEAPHSKARLRLALWLQTLMAWLEVVWAVISRFFHTLVNPRAYAGKGPRLARQE
eukprot:TRINITY_DN30615_c0_g1_i1.p1 TRINITY_DN30615_c0_g1~~TRINITY_DN30615_c0_g1_i1.p1  ORF type:complete len:185 (+),score=26.82 TRINITY_DN30615_c0_g1_i1:69-557(+)